MAKKKTEATGEAVILNEMAQVEKSIEKAYGPGLLVDAQTVLDEPIMTIPLSPALNPVLGGGVPEGSWFILTGPPKFGKCLFIDSMVYTPTGPVKIKDLKTGDKISNSDGTISRVTGVFPQGEKDLYRLTFSDGDSVECCGEHLWEVGNRDRKNTSVLSVNEIKANLISEKKNGRPKWSVKLPEYCYYDARGVYIDPYILGLLIGDGSFRGRGLSFTSIDKEIIDELKADLPKGYLLKPKNYKDYRITSDGKSNDYITILKKYGLWGLKSTEKFIPKQYLYNSFNNREKLLQGLMDTDGHIGKRGQLEYSTSSYQLACDFKELVQSLGGLCKVQERYTTYSGCDKKFKSYRCTPRFSNDVQVFKLNRKKELVKPRLKNPITRKIVSVEPIGKKECTCISVDSRDNLYMTNHHILTHNTTTLLDFCATCQTEQYGSRDVYYLDVEGRLKKMNLTGVKGLRLDKLKVIRSKKGCILSGENFLDIGLHILDNHPGSVIVIDSISALCGETEMSKDMDEATMGGTSLAQGRFVRKAATTMPINKNIIIGITHQNASLAKFGSPSREKTSNALAYQADVKIKAKKIDPWKVGDKQIGQIVTWNVVVSALGPPAGETQSYLRYGHGIDKLTELIVMATELGILTKPEKQSWYTFEYMGAEQKLQGLDGVYQFFAEEKSREEYLQSMINEMLS